MLNSDGTIRKVTSTLRGVGLTNATNKIKIDRYSNKSETGSSGALLDSLNTFNGWMTVFNCKNTWVKYNSVDFGNENLNSVQVKAFSAKGSTLQIRLDDVDGPVIVEVKVPTRASRNTVEAKLSKHQTGMNISSSVR